MAELYSDFLFNPFGSSCAPPPQTSLLPKFPCPRPCQAPGLEQPLGNGFVPGLHSHRVPSTLACPQWVWRGRECLLVSLGNGEVPGVQGCSGSLPRSGQESGAVSRIVPTHLFPQVKGNLSHFPISSSRAAFSGGMPVCGVLYLSQKRVVWLRLRQERLQTGWDGFQGAETLRVSPA